MNCCKTFAVAFVERCVCSIGVLVIMSTIGYAEEPVRIQYGLSPSDKSSARQDYGAGGHAVYERADGRHIMRNLGQQWRAEFDGKGFMVRPEYGSWTWGMELWSVGRSLLSSTSQVSADGNKLSYNWNDDLEEWFVNDDRGLEQGWTIQRRPAGAWSAAEDLTLTLNLSGDLVPRIFENQRSVAFETEDGATALTYGGLKAWDAENRALDSRFTQGEGEATLVIVVDDANATYPITIDPLAQQQQAYLKASNTNPGDLFGGVKISGDTIVVGAVLEDSSATGVNGDQDDNSALGSGAAYVFVRNGPVWSQQAYLKASNTGDNEPGDRFGAVAISGDTIVVGARWEDSSATGVNNGEDDDGAEDSGAAYVFARSGTEWIQQAYLKASNTGGEMQGDNFGRPVAIWGDTIVVGAPFEDSIARVVNGQQDDAGEPFFEDYDSGAVYVFVREGTTWIQQAYLKASNSDPGDHFGASVAIWGDTLIVGASEEDSAARSVNGGQFNDDASNSGAAYVFERRGNLWTQEAYFKASNSEEGDFFGSSVAISGDTVVVGAHSEDSAATTVMGNQADNRAQQAGAAYVFVRENGLWNQQAYLKASNASIDAMFGFSVAVSNNTLAVGARSGVRIPPMEFGAVYLFSREGTVWSEQDIVTASNREQGDRYGTVDVSGDTFVVGAFLEDSAATGVNGSQSNGAPDSGAAYVYRLTPPTPLAIADAFLIGSEFTINFSGESGAVGWKVKGSVDLGSFSDDRTAESTITEISPGKYEAVLDVSGLPPNYYVRIER